MAKKQPKPQSTPKEPRNVHQPWCNIWTTQSKPCNCGGNGGGK